MQKLPGNATHQRNIDYISTQRQSIFFVINISPSHPQPKRNPKVEHRIESYLNISDYMKFDIFYLCHWNIQCSRKHVRSYKTCGVQLHHFNKCQQINITSNSSLTENPFFLKIIVSSEQTFSVSEKINLVFRCPSRGVNHWKKCVRKWWFFIDFFLKFHLFFLLRFFLAITPWPIRQAKC